MALMEGVRTEYLESLADDVFGVFLQGIIAITTLGAVYGASKGVQALGGAVARKQPTGQAAGIG